MTRCSRFARLLALAAALVAQPRGALATIADLIDDLNGTDAMAADAAYQQLFALEELAIPALLANTGETGTYAGGAWINELSSVQYLPEEVGPARGVVSLYLIEAILRNDPTPHRLPRFRHPTITNQTVLFSMAASAYQNWWVIHQLDPIWVLRSTSQPLDPVDVSWR
jgi:hypothetical protein